MPHIYIFRAILEVEGYDRLLYELYIVPEWLLTYLLGKNSVVLQDIIHLGIECLVTGVLLIFRQTYGLQLQHLRGLQL